MTDVTKSSNEYFLTRAQYNARKSAGTLEVGAVYHITDENYVSKVNNVSPDSSGNVTLTGNNIDYDTLNTVNEQLDFVKGVAYTATTTANNAMPKTGGTFSGTVYLNGGASSRGQTISQAKSDLSQQVMLNDGAVKVSKGTSLTTYDENKIVRTAQPSTTQYTTTFNLPNKVDGNTYTIATTSENTYQTTAPTSAISDGGIHIVYLTSEPTTKYNGYIYLIAES